MTGDACDEGAVTGKTLIAVAIVVALAALIGVGLAGGGDTATPSDRSSDRVLAAEPGLATTTTVMTATTTSMVPIAAGTGSNSSVQNQLGYALSAWGRFGGSGDLAELEGLFDPAGPQYQQLVTEAEGIAKSVGTEYQVTMPFPEITDEGDVAFATGLVVFAREDTVDQTFNWRIELRRSDAEGPWVLWTVDDLGNYEG